MQDELIAARIDRLPYSKLHWRILAFLAIPQFFDSVDIFTFPSAAPGLVKFWGMSVNDVALITSAAFFGMFLGASLGGALSDRLGRRRGLILFVTLGAAASLLTALAQDVPMLFAGARRHRVRSRRRHRHHDDLRRRILSRSAVASHRRW